MESGEYGGSGESFTMYGELAAGGAELLLFALLWSFGGVLVAPFVRTLLGKGAVPGAGGERWPRPLGRPSRSHTRRLPARPPRLPALSRRHIRRPKRPPSTPGPST